eukprot:6361661-Prymnesium_polylepis.1
MAKPVTDDKDIENVATIATGSEAMGRTIATCFKRVGANGATMVEDGQVPRRRRETDAVQRRGRDGLHTRVTLCACSIAQRVQRAPRHPRKPRWVWPAQRGPPMRVVPRRAVWRLSLSWPPTAVTATSSATRQTLVDEIDFTEGMEIDR